MLLEYFLHLGVLEGDEVLVHQVLVDDSFHHLHLQVASGSQRLSDLVIGLL